MSILEVGQRVVVRLQICGVTYWIPAKVVGIDWYYRSHPYKVKFESKKYQNREDGRWGGYIHPIPLGCTKEQIETLSLVLGQIPDKK